MSLSRRDAFKLSGLGALGAAGLAIPLGNMVSGSAASLLPKGKIPVPFQTTFQRLEVLPPAGTETDPDTGKTVVVYNITAAVGAVNIVSGAATPVMGYEGRVPARRIDVEQGTPIKLYMRNKLPSPHPTFGTPTALSTHLHGSASLPQYDGYASDLTQPGQVKTYHFPNCQEARMLWYHDHGVHYTAQNVYSGLASQYHLHDEMERELGIPVTPKADNPGVVPPNYEFDVGLTLSDIMFQANAQQLYDDRTRSGLWGDVILVNGKAWPVMKVKRRIYRFRLLNASPSRSYRPTFSPAVPVYMIATDGGLMPKAMPVTSWRHGSAERYEFLMDFRNIPVGTKIEMRNLSNPNNRDYDNTNKIMRFDVIGDAFDLNDPSWNFIPNELNPGEQAMNLKEKDATKVRNIQLKHDDITNVWSLNGKTWEDVIASNFTSVLANPALGATEIWELENSSGGWFHPVHIHLIDFRILTRNGKAPFDYEKGPKDVMYVGEREKVRVIMKFGSTDPYSPFHVQTGRYMIHCHNLVHEDHDMMGQFSVGNGGDNDPIYSDPAIPDDSP